jgi:hypothetical protein
MTASNSSTHAAVWAAIDQIADRKGLTPSELGEQVFGYRQAFQSARRQTSVGKPIWPSTQTVARVCSFAGLTFAQWGAMVELQRQQIEEARHGR